MAGVVTKAFKFGRGDTPEFPRKDRAVENEFNEAGSVLANIVADEAFGLTVRKTVARRRRDLGRALPKTNLPILGSLVRWAGRETSWTRSADEKLRRVAHLEANPSNVVRAELVAQSGANVLGSVAFGQGGVHVTLAGDARDLVWATRHGKANYLTPVDTDVTHVRAHEAYPTEERVEQLRDLAHMALIGTAEVRMLDPIRETSPEFAS